MWTYLLGPFLSLLPKTWRELLPTGASMNWARAATLSGFAEFAGALVALGYWYMYAMSASVDRGVDAALNGKMGPGITTHQIAGVALSVWATHELTWLLGYFLAEGAVRLCGAAFSGSILGTFPLFLLDKILFGAFRRRRPNDLNSAGNFSSNVSSYLGAIHERMLVARLPLVSDELFFRRSATEELLEIRACRRKADWTPPRVVRYQDRYYRLEECSRGAAPRPFHYMLRRLPAGVPGRSVLVYHRKLIDGVPRIDDGLFRITIMVCFWPVPLGSTWLIRAAWPSGSVLPRLRYWIIGTFSPSNLPLAVL